jgi:hypothetical protein
MQETVKFELENALPLIGIRTDQGDMGYFALSR